MTTEFLAETAGMLDYEDIEQRYTGIFKSQKTLPNGDTFDGLRDVISGEILFGRYTNRVTNEVYTGPFSKGMRHGNGAVFFAFDGSKFIGSYRKNQPHRGTWIGKEFTYTGTFYIDEDIQRIEDVNHSTTRTMNRRSSLNLANFHGYGKLFLRAGNIYEGEFDQGKYNGVGKEILPDGSRYTGEFKNGERQGLGTFISSNGTCQSGVWVHDQMVNSHLADVVILPEKYINHVEKKKKEFLSQVAAEKDSSNNSNSNASPKLSSSKLLQNSDDIDINNNDSNIFDFTVTKDALPKITNNNNYEYKENAENRKVLAKAIVKEQIEEEYDDDKCITKTITTSEYTYNGTIIKNNIFHGNGSITYHTKNNGDKILYEGEFQYGKYHGNGKLMTDNKGSVYTGDFSNGQKDGMGTLVEKNGKCYSGDWKYDCRDGEGIETFPDGELYTGQFLKDYRHGKGSLSHNGIVMEGEWDKSIPVHLYDWSISYPDGRKYLGHVMDKHPHGVGKMSYIDYSLYTGHWCDGKRHGSGQLKLSSGKIIRGIWENDEFIKAVENDSEVLSSNSLNTPTNAKNGNKYTGRIDEKGLRQGHGKYIASDYAYEGKHKDSKKHGQGVLRTNDKEYTGSFQNDEFHGEGTLKFTLNLDDNTEPTNAIYKGKFSKGKFNGKGTLTLENGDMYEGDFSDNVKRGIGKEMYSNGTIYRGEYRNNKRNGIGTLQKKQCGGVVYSGSWKDDLLSGEGVLFLDPPSLSNNDANSDGLYAEKYEGELEQGKKSGAGALTISDETILNGRWYQDEPSDYGSWMITYNNGTIYSGSIDFPINNDDDSSVSIMPHPEGFGTMHYINGDFYTGNFHNGKRDGKGLCLLDNGDSLDGEWKNDEFIE